ncbi:MAG: NrtA/SsuA/CpmA family ABC transporter substrate-binding protein [Polyangiales bacterium]
MRLSRRRFVAGAAVAGLAPALAACSNDKTKGAPTLAAEARRKTVRLTHNQTSVPKGRGVFGQQLAAQGIDVTWLGPFPNHAPTLQAVATGTADFSFGGSTTPAAQAILSGAKLKFVAWSLATPRIASILVLPKSGITSVRDLVGKTVAVNKAGLGEFLLVAALEKYGVPRDKVKVSYLNPPDASPAFGAGKVDAWAIWNGPMEMAEVQYGATRLFEEGKELDYQVDFGSFLVRADYAEREPETIRKVIEAYRAEAEWTHAHWQEAQAIGYKVSKYPPAVIAKLDREVITTKWSTMNDEGFAQLQRGFDWLSARNVLNGKLRIEDHAVRL